MARVTNARGGDSIHGKDYTYIAGGHRGVLDEYRAVACCVHTPNARGWAGRACDEATTRVVDWSKGETSGPRERSGFRKVSENEIHIHIYIGLLYINMYTYIYMCVYEYIYICLHNTYVYTYIVRIYRYIGVQRRDSTKTGKRTGPISVRTSRVSLPGNGTHPNTRGEKTPTEVSSQPPPWNTVRRESYRTLERLRRSSVNAPRSATERYRTDIRDGHPRCGRC